MACVVPFICIFFLLVFTINRVVYDTISETAIDTSVMFADEIAGRINNDHYNNRVLLELVSYRLLSIDPSSPTAMTEISDLIEPLLIAKPYVYCIWFTFEPDEFLPGELFSIDFIKRDEGIIKVFNLDVDELHDPIKAPWYYMPFSTGKVWFETADFYDYGVGDGYKYTDTVSMPLKRGGRIIGVAGIDTLYEDQFRFVGNNDIENERRLLLLTQAGEVVYSGDNRFITEFIYNMPNGDNSKIRDALSSNTLTIIDDISPFYGVRSIMTFTPVYAEHASQQLFLYIDTPVGALLRPAANTSQMIIIISIACLLALSIPLLLITRYYLKPIRKITEDANRIAAGDLVDDIDPEFEGFAETAKSSNEISLLSAALKKMVERLRYVQALEIREKTLVAENDMLDRLNNMKTMFFQDMSHDFKTPLTVISVNLLDSLHMLEYGINESDLRENLDDAQREVMRLARMVDNTIKQSQGTRQGMELLDLPALLRESAETYRVLIERNGNRLSLEIPSSLPPIIGNADTLSLVLSNLISNANRYTRGGLITVSAGVRDVYVKDIDPVSQPTDNIQPVSVLVSVTDTGTGIKPELIPTIFKRGVSEYGTGLGLSICKSAIESHGGLIGITSNLGEGTTVYFTIPIVDDSEEEQPPQ